jgi:succinoglycan biosynthesis transport protein ExoP
MSAKPLTDAYSRDVVVPARAAPEPAIAGQSTLQLDVTLALLLRMLRRRKWLLILAIVTVPVLTWIATSQMTPRYTASADIVLQPQQLNIQDIQSVLAQVPVNADATASEIEILSSRALAAQVVERLQLYRLPEFNADLRPPGFEDRAITFVSDLSKRWLGWTPWPDNSSSQDTSSDEAGDADGTDQPSGGPESQDTTADDGAEQSDLGSGDQDGASQGETGGSTNMQAEAPRMGGDSEPAVDEADIIDTYIESLTVEPRNNSRVVEISYTSKDPKLAASIVNALVDIYLVNQLEGKFDALKRASSWLNERLASLRDQANQSEDAVESYRATAGLTEGAQASIVAEQITKVNVQLSDARAALSAAQAQLDQARAFSNTPAQLESLPEVLDYPVIQQLVQQKALLERQVVDMSSKLGERHPDLLNIKAQLQSVKAQIVQEIQRVIRGIEPQVRAAKSRVDSLETELSRLREESIKYNESEAKLRTLQREAETNQGLLKTFLERAKETTDRFELESPDARLLANALVPKQPSEPKARLMLGVSAVFGVFLGLLLVYVAELLNQTFRSGDDIDAVLGISCLSIVPKLRLVGGHVSPYDYVLKKPMSAYAEAFRSLRAALWLGGDLGRGSCKSVVVMSSRPGEGKTAVSVSLARVVAAAGEKVMLVDCDVRLPSVGKALKAEPSVGLIDILMGKATREQAVRKDAGSGMDYILIGTQTPNSGQLLMSDAMSSLVRALRDDYDLVVLDAPPVLALADARILASMVDAVVYCVQWRETSRSTVSSGIRILRGIGANVIGAILTQVNLGTHSRAGFSDSELYSSAYSGYYRS